VTCVITCARDELDNGATYGGEILHANLRRAWEGHGLGLISIGVFIGKKIYFLEHHKTTADWMTSSVVCGLCDDVITMCVVSI